MFLSLYFFIWDWLATYWGQNSHLYKSKSCILIKISLKFVLENPIHNKSVLDQAVVWCWTDRKQLPGTTMNQTYGTIWPQWVNLLWLSDIDLGPYCNRVMACWLHTKPLPEPMLTYHSWGSVAFIWKQFHRKCSWYQSVKWVWKFHFYDNWRISLGANKSRKIFLYFSTGSPCCSFSL